MGLKEWAEKGEEQAKAKKKAKEEKAFAELPRGRARAAREAGSPTLQVVWELKAEGASVVDEVEEEGWRLDQVGYVYAATGESRKWDLGSGGYSTFSGKILAVYLFRPA